MAAITTNGWDVVSVTDIDTLNKITAGNDYHPAEFEQIINIVNLELRIDGEWGEWQIAKEASGKNVYMQCLIQNGSVSFNGQNNSLNANEELSSITIQISLAGLETSPEKWLSPDDETSIITDETECFELKLNNERAIIITQANFTNKELYSKNLADSIESAFKIWFNDNIDEFKQIFAVVLIGLRANEGNFQWLKPSAYSYSANSSIDQKTAAFGALTLIDGKTEIGHLQQTVDVGALQLVKPFGANSALIVSREMFVKHILLPSAISIVKSSIAADFDISDSGLSLTNNKEMVWQDFQGDNYEKMSPVLPKNSFNLTLQSDYIHISIVGANYRPEAGVTLYMNLEQNFKYKVERNKDGEPVFVPDEKGLGEATLNCTAVLDEWLKWMEMVTGIISGIASVLMLGTGLAGAIAKGASRTVVGAEVTRTATFSFKLWRFSINLSRLAPVAARIQSGVVSNPVIFNTVKIASRVITATTGATAGSIAIADAVYKEIYADVPAFRDFSDNFVSATKWPVVDNLELQSASLADSFIIGLNLT